MIKDEDIRFGETTVKDRFAHGRGYVRRKVRYMCVNCGSYEIEVKCWNDWDESEQKWVHMETCDDDCDSAYCRNCGDVVEIEEQRIPVPGAK